jgi:hypothetical protein
MQDVTTYEFIFVIQQYMCLREISEHTRETENKDRDGNGDEAKEDNAGNGKQIRIFVIVRAIRHRGIRGDDLSKATQSVRDIIRSITTIIDYAQKQYTYICMYMYILRAHKIREMTRQCGKEYSRKLIRASVMREFMREKSEKRKRGKGRGRKDWKEN